MPSGFLRDAEIAPDFVAADSVLAGDKQPNSGKPLFQPDGAFLEDGSGLQCESLPLARFVFPVAFPDAGLFEPSDALASTTGTLHDSVRPAQLNHERLAVLEIREVDDRFL